MSETYQFKLPLLQAAQAQKHVTVNEALTRLDALAQLQVQSRSADVPVAPVDGQAYIVPVGATGAWAGQDHAVALYLNGGWELITAVEGWSAWIIDEGVELRFQMGVWGFLEASVDPNLAALQVKALAFDHTIIAGTDNTTSTVIPAQSIVYGVTGRVSQAITGPVDFGVGIPGNDDYYGASYGLTYNSSLIAIRSRIIVFSTDTPLVLNSHGGDFVDGSLRLVIHYATLKPPAAF